MSHAANYLKGMLANFFRTAVVTKSTGHWIALFNVLPGKDGLGGVELSGGGYARIRHGPADANWGAMNLSTSTIVNTAGVSFATPTANWLTVNGFGIYDALTAGNLLVVAPLVTPIQVNLGDPAPAFAIGDLAIVIE